MPFKRQQNINETTFFNQKKFPTGPKHSIYISNTIWSFISLIISYYTMKKRYKELPEAALKVVKMLNDNIM